MLEACVRVCLLASCCRTYKVGGVVPRAPGDSGCAGVGFGGIAGAGGAEIDGFGGRSDEGRGTM